MLFAFQFYANGFDRESQGHEIRCQLLMKISLESLPLLISAHFDSFFKVRRTAVRRKNRLLSAGLFGIASFHPDSSPVKGFASLSILARSTRHDLPTAKMKRTKKTRPERPGRSLAEPLIKLRRLRDQLSCGLQRSDLLGNHLA